MLAGLGFRDAGEEEVPADVPGRIVLQLTPEQLAELRAAYHAYLAGQSDSQRAMSAVVSGSGMSAPSSVPLTLANWLAIVNDHPDDAPHTLIVGTTGTGKTTLAQAI